MNKAGWGSGSGGGKTERDDDRDEATEVALLFSRKCALLVSDELAFSASNYVV